MTDLFSSTSPTKDEKWWGWRGGATPLPLELAPVASEVIETSTVRRLPELEKEFVQQFYDTVASQWKGSRLAAWPCVRRFIAALPKHTLVCDAGCGDGKNLSLGPFCGTGPTNEPCSRVSILEEDDRLRGSGQSGLCSKIDDISSGSGSGMVIGSDNSLALASLSTAQGYEAMGADALCLPFRDNCFGASMSIAVLHHISSLARRRLLLHECARVLCVGGRALTCAWAREQLGMAPGGVAGKHNNVFGAADLMVPWTGGGRPAHNMKHTLKQPPTSEVDPHPAPAPTPTSLPAGSADSSQLDKSGRSAVIIKADAEASSKYESKSSQVESEVEVQLRDETIEGSEEVNNEDDSSNRKSMHLRRYCHVFEKGELAALVGALNAERLAGPWLKVEEDFYAEGHWCLVFTKIAAHQE